MAGGVGVVKLQRLVNQGNSVVVIKHNLDVLKAADGIVDLDARAG